MEDVKEDMIINDIINDHSERMQNLKKYYPFFKLQETVFHVFKEGKYDDIDMGYVTLAVLRFFIEENNFNDRPVNYSMYETFLLELLERDFEICAEQKEKKELALHIFDKLKNDGKPFYMEYFDPVDRKRKTTGMKLIDSKIEDDMVYYYISADAIAFYLDTKEIKDESKISIQQVLLEKMIATQNFKGGIDVIKRINSEVSKLRVRKMEVLGILSFDVFEGIKAFEEYVSNGMRWFDEEQELFVKNKELVELALERVEAQVEEKGMNSGYYSAIEEVYLLETELKRAIARHGELLADSMELQVKADEIIKKAKLSRLRPAFDFNAYVGKAQEIDDIGFLEYLGTPFLMPKITKSFHLKSMEDLLNYRMSKEEEGEKVEEKKEEVYRYEDEIEEDRILENFMAILRTLLDTLLLRKKFDLREFNGVLELKFFDYIFKNSDYYSFLIHLCQKKEYDLEALIIEQDTFLEGILAKMLLEGKEKRYQKLKFKIELDQSLGEDFIWNKQILQDGKKMDFVTSNIHFICVSS